MWIIEFFIETIVKDSELISLPFTAEYYTALTGKKIRTKIAEFPT